MRSIDEFTWPLARLGEGIEELARRAGLCRASPETLAPPPSITPAHSTDLGRWIEWAGGRLGIEAEAVETTYAEVDALIEGAGPAVIALRGGGELRFLMVMRPGKGQVRLLTPDLGARSCSVQLIRDAVCAGLEAPLAREIDQLLTRAKVPARSRPRAQRSMIDERLGSHPVGECWVLRPAPAASFFGQLAQARLPRRVWGVLGLFAIVYLLEILGWGLIGEAAMNGRLDMGWLGAWVLLLVTLVPLRLLAEWLDATFALDAGRVLKKRLLAGALNLDIEAVRHQGAGRLLGRVMESQALESLALNGGLTVLVSALELSFAVSILAIGAGGSLHLILAGVWTLLTIGLSLRYHRRLREWILTRLAMTHDLIEQMVGHRTRLAQEWPQHRGQSEDQALKEYLDRSRKLDATVIPIAVVMPTGWTLLGLLGLAPAFVAGTAEPSSLAIGLGGIMLANRAFGGISGGLAGLARAVIAWEQVAPLFRAGGLAGTPAAFLPSIDPTGVPVAGPRDKLIDASQLVFRYRPEGEAVLRGVDLTIHHGDRILLEGSSGGGKSTLAALLVGLRKPESGLLLLNGLDRPTLGDNWQRLATEAPQFHENHILSGTLGFNLLMGRNWPASDEELLAARELCIELGLGPLLERMPAGMMQMVGETGWQLSHGERSRIFLARALLQDAQLTVLDESFAALDPETLRECLNCAFARARTLMVIAHPELDVGALPAPACTMPPSNAPPSQVFVIASYMRDLGVRVDQFPRPGETRVGGDFLESHGGKGSNQAIQAARCGARVAIVAAVGADAPGERACELWRTEGLDGSGVVTRAGQTTGTALILVDDRGENQIVIAPGANTDLTPADIDAAATALDQAGVVVCQLETPLACTLHAFARARAAGAITVLNSAPAPAQLPAPLWALTDILIANEIEAAALSGCPPDTDPAAMARVLLGRVARGVAITLGSQGALWCETGAAPVHQPAPRVDVIDTTGAGDAFVGAFVAAWARQPEPRQALIAGVTAGSLACTRRGVVPALADAAAIARLLAAGTP